ncbi:hypothetical protein BI350_13205 [Sporosarcina ureilytica]|uniref:Cell-wall binding lipoprotein n=2 Tax=Sporosarcina ureilytica TaxID=298596 RepID=A0A1D8JKM7_9BACL|nr:hypothetical protein BI350_13205 [Sporosarcina ureilytica]
MLMIVLSVMFVLSGCTLGSTIEDELSNVLSEMHEAEKTYRDGLKDLTKIEQTEQNLFNQTMELSQEENEKLKTNIEEMKALLKKRKIHIKEETKSMESAMKLVSDIDKIEKKSEGDTKAEVVKLKNAIDHRYQTHTIFVDKYEKLTKLQGELYEMLLVEEIDITKLEQKVEALNAQNDEVTNAIKEFNEATNSLNETKDAAFAYFKKNKSK